MSLLTFWIIGNLEKLTLRHPHLINKLINCVFEDKPNDAWNDMRVMSTCIHINSSGTQITFTFKDQQTTADKVGVVACIEKNNELIFDCEWIDGRKEGAAVAGEMRHPVPCIIKHCDSLLSHRISLDRLPSKPNSLSLSSFVGLATEPKNT